MEDNKNKQDATDRPLRTIIEDLENAAAAVASQTDSHDRLQRPFETVEVPPEHLQANVSAVTFKSNSLFVPTLYPSMNDNAEGDLVEQMDTCTVPVPTTSTVTAPTPTHTNQGEAKIERIQGPNRVAGHDSIDNHNDNSQMKIQSGLQAEYGKATLKDGNEDSIHPSSNSNNNHHTDRQLQTIIEDLENAAAAVAEQPTDDRLTQPFETLEVPPEHLQANVSTVTFQSNSLFVPTLYPSANHSVTLEEAVDATASISITKKESENKILPEDEEPLQGPHADVVVVASGKRSQKERKNYHETSQNEGKNYHETSDEKVDTWTLNTTPAHTLSTLPRNDDKQSEMEKYGIKQPVVGIRETTRLEAYNKSSEKQEMHHVLDIATEITEQDKLDKLSRATIVTTQPHSEEEEMAENIDGDHQAQSININNDPTLPTDTDIPPMLPPLTLNRGRNLRPETQPGAVAVSNAMGVIVRILSVVWQVAAVLTQLVTQKLMTPQTYCLMLHWWTLSTQKLEWCMQNQLSKEWPPWFTTNTSSQQLVEFVSSSYWQYPSPWPSCLQLEIPRQLPVLFLFSYKLVARETSIRVITVETFQW